MFPDSTTENGRATHYAQDEGKLGISTDSGVGQLCTPIIPNSLNLSELFLPSFKTEKNRERESKEKSYIQ